MLAFGRCPFLGSFVVLRCVWDLRICLSLVIWVIEMGSVIVVAMQWEEEEVVL